MIYVTPEIRARFDRAEAGYRRLVAGSDPLWPLRFNPAAPDPLQDEIATAITHAQALADSLSRIIEFYEDSL